ncbi:MAG: THUMP domain-containing protein [Ideonella sp.]|nr:THUMP domain-containing protein [Ideonella sp.]
MTAPPTRPPGGPRRIPSAKPRAAQAPASYRAERVEPPPGGSLFLPCAAGVEPFLVDECARLLPPGMVIEPSRGGVYIDPPASAAFDTAMRLNLVSRLAQRVLWQVASGRYEDEHHLYDIARGVRWEDWITPSQTLRVDTSAYRSPLRSLNFASLRIKDAVCDHLRELCGERPSVDTYRPDLSLVLHLGPEHATLSVDLSGEALFKRGWREVKGEAPLKETLAAAMLAAAGWHGREEDGGLLDPCCGAGTIAIEAAQVACGIAPGLNRAFAFERLLPFREHLPAWRRLREQAQDAIHAPAVPIWAGDVSFRMTDFATRNAERAGVARAIEFKTADALQRPCPAERGTLLMNPPYGERIAPKGQGSQAYDPRDDDRYGDRHESRHDGRYVRERQPAPRQDGGEAFEGAADASDFYARLAAHWKKHYTGWSAWVLTPEPKLPSLMRLKESRRVPLWNGPIECRMFRFDMVAGGNRKGGEDVGA